MTKNKFKKILVIIILFIVIFFLSKKIFIVNSFDNYDTLIENDKEVKQNENEIVDLLINNDELLYKNPNILVEIVLDNITTLESLNIFIRKYNNLISRSSNSKFKMLFNKYKTLSKDSENVIDDFELIRLFKSKFYNLGVVRTIKLFDRIKYYELDEFTVYVVLELLDIAYYD